MNWSSLTSRGSSRLSRSTSLTSSPAREVDHSLYLSRTGLEWEMAQTPTGRRKRETGRGGGGWVSLRLLPMELTESLNTIIGQLRN